jgi:hypothetical protein
LSAIVGILGENVKKIYIMVGLCIIIAAIAIASIIIFRPKPAETPPEHACGAIVTLKSPTDTEEVNNFLPSDTVYAKGSGMRISATYKIYIIPDTTITEGMAIPAPVIPPVTVTTDGNGAFTATIIWSPTLTPGAYDIIADCQTSGVKGYYDDSDAIDDYETHVTAGFFVIPEAALGTIGALSAAFAAAFLKYRKAF